MKTRLLFILLFLGGAVFLGCKKSKPTIIHVPDTLVKQDSFQHIMDSLQYINSAQYKDSLQIVSLEPNFIGTYLVAGTYLQHEGVHHDVSGVLTDDTLIITQVGGAYLVATLYTHDVSLYYTSGSILSAGWTGPAPNFPDGPSPPPANGYYLSYTAPYYFEGLSFSKTNINSIYFTSLTPAYLHLYLTGTKIH